MNTARVQNAVHFHSLHTSTRPLALSNAWDVASALIAEAAGAPAIATTSAGVAWSLGLPDGNRLDRARAVAVVAGIAAAVAVPVTADIEGGYAVSLDGVSETVKGLLDAGAVGINIEDGHRTPADLAARIAASRRTADAAGIALFINARTDVFLAGIGAPEQRVELVLERANQYVEAGADGIFVPGVTDADLIAELTAGISVPVNMMVGPGALSVDDLARLGVARVSLGSGVAQAAYAVVQRATRELTSTGTYEALSDALEYGTLNDLVAATAR